LWKIDETADSKGVFPIESSLFFKMEGGSGELTKRKEILGNICETINVKHESTGCMDKFQKRWISRVLPIRFLVTDGQ
jgi:hypothetical protein